MSLTVKDLYQYNPNFDPKKIAVLTGKTNFEKDDTIVFSRVVGLNDKDFSIFVAQKEGKSFVNSISDDNMRTQVAEAAGVSNQKGKNDPMSMDGSIFPLKPEVNFG